MPTPRELLSTIVAEDVVGLAKAEESYGDSWCKRGGIGAYMMMARKWDRIERAIEPPANAHGDGQAQMSSKDAVVQGYDIFAGIKADKRAEGLIDDIRDLRRYLLLVEARARLLGLESAQSTHRDNV